MSRHTQKNIRNKEERIYMGPKKLSRIPRGAKVVLLGRIGKTAIARWKDIVFTCPIRILHKPKGCKK